MQNTIHIAKHGASKNRAWGTTTLCGKPDISLSETIPENKWTYPVKNMCQSCLAIADTDVNGTPYPKGYPEIWK